jgi:hypothetical protein
MDREGPSILPLSLLEIGPWSRSRRAAKRPPAVRAALVECWRPAVKPRIEPARSAACSDDLAGAEASFGALAHKVYEINQVLCLVNTNFIQFAQSG